MKIKGVIAIVLTVTMIAVMFSGTGKAETIELSDGWVLQTKDGFSPGEYVELKWGDYMKSVHANEKASFNRDYSLRSYSDKTLVLSVGNAKTITLMPYNDITVSPGEFRTISPGEFTKISPGEFSPGEFITLSPGEFSPGEFSVITSKSVRIDPGEYSPGEFVKISPGEFSPGEFIKISPGEYRTLSPGEYTVLDPGEFVTLDPGEYGVTLTK